MIHSICVWYPLYDTQTPQCLYLVSMIHNIYVRITTLILYVIHPSDPIFPYLIIGETAALVDWSGHSPKSVTTTCLCPTP